jgi:hypothetical protein
MDFSGRDRHLLKNITEAINFYKFKIEVAIAINYPILEFYRSDRPKSHQD